MTLPPMTPKETTTMTEVTKEAARPQDHWLVVGAIKAARALIKAADDLSFAAQITGGTAGRDAALCAAVAQWTAERDKQKQMLRIIEIEGDDPAIGAGFELCPSPLATADAEIAALRGEVERLRAENAELEKRRAKAWRTATDRQYMLDAIKPMLGPKGQQVIAAWDARGTIRVHFDWGPEGAKTVGEERAQLHLDIMEAEKTAVPIGNFDEHFKQTDCRAALTDGARDA